jgi:hypothetical protein
MEDEEVSGKIDTPNTKLEKENITNTYTQRDQQDKVSEIEEVR